MDQNKLTILSVNKYFWRKGGSEAVFFNEKELLESSGHKVIPFSMHSEKNEQTEYSKYFVSEVDYSRNDISSRVLAASKIIYSFEARRKVSSLLKNNKIDLSHFHIFQHQISPSVFEPLRRNNIPIILTLHDLKPICPNYKMYTGGKVCEKCLHGDYYNCFLNRCTKNSKFGSLVNSLEMYFHDAMGYYKNVDQYIAVSKFYRDKMIQAGHSKNKVAYIPNYIECEQYGKDSEYANYVLYFGRLSEEKGISTLIEAAKAIPKIPIRIVGSGPSDSDLREYVESKGVKNVSFGGFQTGQVLKNILSKALCIVLPSEWYENCPMSILESFASKKPVIGSNIGGIPELINDQEDGLLFEPGNASQLTERISWIWGNKAKAREMGMSGRRKVEIFFSASRHYDDLLELYSSHTN